MKTKAEAFKKHFLDFLKSKENLTEEEETQIESLINEFGEAESEINAEIEANSALRKKHRQAIIDSASGSTFHDDGEDDKQYTIEDFDSVVAELSKKGSTQDEND